MRIRKIISAVFFATALMAGAQSSVPVLPGSDSWGVGVNAGIVSPLRGHGFWGNARPAVGLDISKRLTPAFSLGAEGLMGFNTSRLPRAVYSPTGVDMSYAGLFGAVDFTKLGGKKCSSSRFFSLGIQAGAGWGHEFRSRGESDHNFFATKAGLFFSFNVAERFSVTFSPSVIWDMSDAGVGQSTAAYSANSAMFSLQAGLRYRFGAPFRCMALYDASLIDNLNGQVNTLRAALDNARASNAVATAEKGRLTGELAACNSSKKEIVKEVVVNNRLNTERNVFFLLGSSTITPDQMPNVELIAAYMKNHPEARVVIKGYASRDGNRERNLELAQRRAESVRNTLIKKFRIAPTRITAEGAGIGDLFAEESWNRVSVCTLED